MVEEKKIHEYEVDDKTFRDIEAQVKAMREAIPNTVNKLCELITHRAYNMADRSDEGEEPDIDLELARYLVADMGLLATEQISNNLREFGKRITGEIQKQQEAKSH